MSCKLSRHQNGILEQHDTSKWPRAPCTGAQRACSPTDRIIADVRNVPGSSMSGSISSSYSGPLLCRLCCPAQALCLCSPGFALLLSVLAVLIWLHRADSCQRRLPSNGIEYRRYGCRCSGMFLMKQCLRLLAWIPLKRPVPLRQMSAQMSELKHTEQQLRRNRLEYVVTQQQDFELADAADLVLQTVHCQPDADLHTFPEVLGLLHLDGSCVPLQLTTQQRPCRE